VDSELAAKITRTAHRHGKKTVGVFVNAMIENVIKIVKETDIDVVQLHGDESVEYCMELIQKLEKLYEKKPLSIKFSVSKLPFIYLVEETKEDMGLLEIDLTRYDEK